MAIEWEDKLDQYLHKQSNVKLVLTTFEQSVNREVAKKMQQVIDNEARMHEDLKQCLSNDKEN